MSEEDIGCLLPIILFCFARVHAAQPSTSSKTAWSRTGVGMMLSRSKRMPSPSLAATCMAASVHWLSREDGWFGAQQSLQKAEPCSQWPMMFGHRFGDMSDPSMYKFEQGPSIERYDRFNSSLDDSSSPSSLITKQIWRKSLTPRSSLFSVLSSPPNISLYLCPPCVTRTHATILATIHLCHGSSVQQRHVI